MWSSMNVNLYKSGFINFSEEDIKVIDSNQKIADRLNALLEAEKPVSDSEDARPFDLQEFEDAPKADSVDGEDAAVSALFGEDAEADAAAVLAAREAEKEAQEQKAQDIVEEAQKQADEILESARNEAEVIRQHAKDDGRKEGHQEGLIQAQQEIEQKEKNLKQLEMELKEKYDEQLSEMEPYLVEKLSGVYEYLIGVELSKYKNILMYMIDHTLHSTEASESYLLHVSEQDFSYVMMQKNQLMADSGLTNATLDVVEDKTLTKNQCLIETENGIFDCSLSVQLEELKRKLMLLAYGQKGE